VCDRETDKMKRGGASVCDRETDSICGAVGL